MINYKIVGKGPWLVLIHGFGISFDIWKNLEPLLAQRFQLIQVELPGLGESPLPQPEQPYFERCAEEVERLRQALGIERWAMLCYSMGARVGEAYMGQNAEHVSQVIYLCPVYTHPIKAYGLRFALRIDQRWPSTGDWVLSGWRLETLVRLLGFNGNNHPYSREWYQAISLQSVPSLKVSLRGLPKGGCAPFKLPPVPSVFIWGKHDMIVSHPMRLRTNDVLIAAGHSAPVLAAPRIAEIVERFLEN